MSLSKHQRDLPQLCSLAIISQMSLLDRISAHQVCPEWYHRVREVNQSTVRPLTITVGDRSVKDYERIINTDKKVLHSARLLTNSDGSLQFPMHRLTKWNHFQLSDNDQLNLVTLKQIASTFYFVTELIFASTCCDKFELLTEMLQNDHWRRQLISLKVIGKSYPHYSDPTIIQSLFTAINSLPALKYLQLGGVKLYDLPILAQLKEIKCDYEDTFPRVLQQYAVKNTGELSVEVFFNSSRDALFHLSILSDQIRSSITCMNYFTLHIDNFLVCGTSFPNLTSLTLWFLSSQLSQLFPALSQLHRLQQLDLAINFYDLDPEHPFPPPQAQLRSVKALDLTIYLNSHSQLHWLNLPVTMPNLQAIHLHDLDCEFCETKRGLANLQTNIVEPNCFRDVLQFFHKSTGLPLNRLSYYYNKQFYTLSEGLF